MDHAARIIDANANRAREGPRVMEDTARFTLNDSTLTADCKDARHQLRAALGTLPLRETDLVMARDTPGDVGTAITTELEHTREQGIASMVSAACKRTTEALRTIEEASKLIGSDACAFETIRYRVYDLEKRLLLRLAPKCPQWKLCVLITTELCTHHSPVEIIKRAAASGAECIQIREKTMPDAQLLDYCSSLVETCRSLGVHSIINDHVGIAKLTNADGVHLGKDDLPTNAARQILGIGRWIGRTCSSHADAVEAIKAGADSCGLGPVFPSPTKPKPALSGPQLIADYTADQRTAGTPYLAISGITPENIESLAHAGCKGVAVSSAVCMSEDPGAVCRLLVEGIAPPTLRA
ncbi:MAG: thiamine phosphate synthase [Phycisphaerales bacterium]|nr:thiamine phosphate synthase [Phycisphaerales bacterium]